MLLVVHGQAGHIYASIRTFLVYLPVLAGHFIRTVFFLTVWMGGKDLYFCRSDLSHSIHLLCCAKLLVSNVCKLAYAYSSGWCLGVVLHSITVYHQGLETDRVTNRPRSLQFHEQERQIGNNNVTTHHKTLENIYEE